MSLRCVSGVLRSMQSMGPRCVRMVCSFLVASRLVMRRRFGVMPGCVRKVF